MTHTWKFLLAVFAIVVMASTTYAFASANTFLPGTRGEGVGSLSGYAVTNIAFGLNANPAYIDSVSFTLDKTAASVKISLDASGSDWYACSYVAGRDWNCQTPGESLKSADQVRVIAFDK
jgi:hypothetical protein